MKHVLKSALEVAHEWIRQDPEQEWASYGNVMYKGNTIYSYRWWPMAVIQEDGVILMRNWNYSSSTAKHMRDVGRAAENHEVIFCNDPSSPSQSLESFVNDLKASMHGFDMARKKTKWIHQNQRDYEAMQTYCDYMGKAIPDAAEQYRITDTDEILAILAKEEAKEAERMVKIEEAEAECAMRNAELDAAEGVDITKGELEKEWMEGGTGSAKVGTGDRWQVRGAKLSLYTPWGYRLNRHDFSQTRIRIANNRVETSQDANITLEEGKRMWELMKHKSRLIGERFGGYAVTGWNGSLRIGCHEISREEVIRFVLYYGWATREDINNLETANV